MEAIGYSRLMGKTFFPDQGMGKICNVLLR